MSLLNATTKMCVYANSELAVAVLMPILQIWYYQAVALIGQQQAHNHNNKVIKVEIEKRTMDYSNYVRTGDHHRKIRF